MVGFTAFLADRALSWAPQHREAMHDRAARAVLDTLGVSLAALDDPTVTTGLGALGRGGPGSATLLATGDTTDSRHAALLGGLTGHALDYDDVDDAMIGHPSTVLAPALLAVAEELDLTGEQVADAFGIGVLACREVAAQLGIAGHYAAGWHATGTVGTIGATAALARLRGLDLPRTRHALGIAGSLAGGSRRNFGTMTKPLHAGFAASNAVLASSLAAGGFTADPEQLEAPLGFLALHHGQPEPVGQTPPGLDTEGLNVKLYPCCYYIHCAADALLDLVAEGLRADDVERLLVTVQPGGLAPVIHARPTTGLQGKFSIEYAMAAVLLDQRLVLRTFTDEQVQRHEAQELLRRVEKVEAEVPPVGGGPADGAFAVVQVWTTSGQLVTRRVDRARGHASRPVEEADLRAKFLDCVDFAGLDPVAGSLVYDALRQLATTSSVRATLTPLRELVADHQRAAS